MGSVVSRSYGSGESSRPSPQARRSKAIGRLTARLGLFDAWSQDWAVEAADAGRVEEFCRVYAASDPPLTSDEKGALMELIIASLDDYLAQTPFGLYDPAVCAEVEHLLEKDFALHVDTIEQWCQGAEDDTDDVTEDTDDEGFVGWACWVTPIMRRIRAACSGSGGGSGSGSGGGSGGGAAGNSADDAASGFHPA